MNVTDKIDCSPSASLISLSSNITDLSNRCESKMASELYLPRNPLICPIDECEKKHIFLSDYSKHMICDHAKIRHAYMQPGNCHKFLLNPMENYDENSCQYFYLVTEKIR